MNEEKKNNKQKNKMETHRFSEEEKQFLRGKHIF